MNKKDVVALLRNKKLQWAATIIIFLIILFISSSIRLSNWDLLTDSTTGEKIPLALDPYYFLRVAETIVETDGNLSAFDEMRGPGFNTPWHLEIMPRVVVGMWKIANNFGDYSLQSVDIFSPVFFYGIGLAIFFFLAYALTKSKFAGILASMLLAVIPSYLYRTMAGFSDHEAIGMIAFFGTLLVYTLSLKYLDGIDKRKFLQGGLCGIALGLLTALTVATWGGVSAFIFMIIPIGFLLFWVLKLKDREDVMGDVGILFYVAWLLASIVFTAILGLGINGTIGRITSSTGIITLATLGFIILDRILIFAENKIKIKNYNKRYRVFYTLGALIIASFALLPLIGKNFFTLLWQVLNRLLNPLWGAGRLDTTVAENAQPYLTDWIAGSGGILFFLFVLGIILLAVEFSKYLSSRKGRILLSAGFLAMAFGVLFSRISSTSILNGNGIFSLSGLAYLGGLAFFAYAFLKNYFNKEIKVDPLVIVMFSWMIVVLVTGRSTTRLFFAIAPFMCISASYAVITMFRYWRKKSGDEIIRVIITGGLIASLILSVLVINSSYVMISNQAKYTGPSANTQWQGAMEWVRNSTNDDAVFSHWWDYGYWVETLGQRATVADGGHFQGIYGGNHKIGRYVLTTPYPETALSFFKTMDIDYLLIDQTDLGKYPAYSKIGGGEGEESYDRYSAIPIMMNDPKQTRETANGTMIVFSGGSYLFEDIIYNDGSKNIFLPAGKAAVVGIVMSLEDNSLRQPDAIYIYNNIQIRIPVRYIYINGEIVDFGSGLDVIVDVVPAFDGQGINQLGAAIYLSQKVSKSLFAQLYLMDDPFGNYETLELVHTEENPVVASLRSQGVALGDFIIYQGFRGPIKIWNTENIPGDINIVEEFKESLGGRIYGAMDDLEFSSSVTSTGTVELEIEPSLVEDLGFN